MARFATIDIGTNSVLLLVAEPDGAGAFRPITDEAEVTRLGEWLGRTGVIGEPGAERTAAAIGRFVARARALGVDEIAAVGTMCLRTAQNAGDFLARVRREHGLAIEVIPGEEEARLSFRAVRRALPAGARRAVVFDIGGGSTEVILGDAGTMEQCTSLAIGVVRLLEDVLVSDPVRPEEVARARAEVATSFAAVPIGAEVDAAIGVGGTFTTMVAVMLGMTRYDPARVEGATLTRAEIERQIALYAGLTVAERRRLPGLLPGRADVILPGAAIAAALLDRFDLGALSVSDAGVRHGLFLSRFVD